MDINQIPVTKDIPDIVDFINDLFDSAITQNVSDIHIETNKEYLLIRFRQD